LVWFGLVWFHLVSFGFILFCFVSFRFILVHFGSFWFILVHFGSFVCFDCCGRCLRYDFMALVPIVEGAGGALTDWQGERVTLDLSNMM
jgi:fructose-1,6-bisphosphatase/inositol monophosphatase family enzyme